MSPEKGLSQMELLLRRVPDDRREDFIEYVEKLVCEDDSVGIDMSFLGFIEDYENFAQLLVRKADIREMGARMGWEKQRLTVYDVGCCLALQHVLFDPRINYVGIDIMKETPRFFRDGCTFIQGRFSDVVGQLAINPTTAIGISNMSLLYGSPAEESALFDRTFRKKFVL